MRNVLASVMNRKAPVWLLALVIFLGIASAVMFGWLVRHTLLVPEKQEERLGSIVLRIASFPELVGEALGRIEVILAGADLFNGEKKILASQLIPNNFRSLVGFAVDGVVPEAVRYDQGFLLLSFWDYQRGQSIVQLIRITDQRIVYEWVPHISLQERDWKRWMHPLLLQDGGLLIKPEHGALERIDLCGNLLWRNDDYVFHHSIEVDEQGNFWVPGRLGTDGRRPFSGVDWRTNHQENVGGYEDELLIKVSPTGEVLFEASVGDILIANGFLTLLLGIGPTEVDPLHLNDIQPATSSTEFWETGDLLVSLRNRSTVFLYRPRTNKILWLQSGPWLNQHDADFLQGSKISVFGNDTFRYGSRTLLANGHNDVYVVDFQNQITETPFSDVLRSYRVQTPAEGLHEILETGDLFVEETYRSRLLRLSRKELLWQFSTTVDDDFVAQTSWTRYLSHEVVENLIPILEAGNCRP